MKLASVFFSLSLALSVQAASHLYCKGASYSEDGLVYPTISLSARFETDSASFHLYADGNDGKGNYDIHNRFSDVPFVGQFEKGSTGRIVGATMKGKYLPDARGILLDLDLSHPETVAKLAFEREDGVELRALLNCGVTLDPICKTVRKCYNHCYPKLEGCTQHCENRTVCEDAKF